MSPLALMGHPLDRMKMQDIAVISFFHLTMASKRPPYQQDKHQRVAASTCTHENGRLSRSPFYIFFKKELLYVIQSGVIAHFQLFKCSSVSHEWSSAGFNTLTHDTFRRHTPIHRILRGVTVNNQGIS